MAVGPIGAMIYVNHQARLDAQNAAAVTATNEKSKEFQAVRPTEETYKIDPEKSIKEKKVMKKLGLIRARFFKKRDEDDKEKENFPSNHLLDITI